MDLNEMLVFTRVVDAGSFTAAAAKLDMPKSTVSRKVSALEERLGARLLHRTTRKLHLTDVGADFYERCASIVRAVAEAEQAVTETQDTPKGRLRLTAPVDFGVEVLAPLIARFLELNPLVQLDVELTGRVVDLVAEGFDVAIRAGRLPDSSLIARKLGSTQIHVVASPDYLQVHGCPKRPEELAGHTFVLHNAPSMVRTFTLHGAGGVREVEVVGRVSVNEYGVVHRLAAAGFGLAAVPDVICAQDVREGRLVQVLPGWAVPEGAIYAVYPSTRHLSAALRAFLDFVKAEMTPPPWRVGA